MLDEPFEGLAPIIVEDLVALCGRLAEAGATIVIVEQDVQSALLLARRVYVLNNGHVAFEGTRDTLLADPEITSRYLGIGLETGEPLHP